MLMVVVVPVEELGAPSPPLLDVSEATGKVRLVFEGLE
jgi:hypothetical protein